MPRAPTRRSSSSPCSTCRSAGCRRTSSSPHSPPASATTRAGPPRYSRGRPLPVGGRPRRPDDVLRRRRPEQGARLDGRCRAGRAWRVLARTRTEVHLVRADRDECSALGRVRTSPRDRRRRPVVDGAAESGHTLVLAELGIEIRDRSRRRLLRRIGDPHRQLVPARSELQAHRRLRLLPLVRRSKHPGDFVLTVGGYNTAFRGRRRTPTSPGSASTGWSARRS